MASIPGLFRVPRLLTRAAPIRRFSAPPTRIPVSRASPPERLSRVMLRASNGDAVNVSAGAAVDYFAPSQNALNLPGTLTITAGGAGSGTRIGCSIGTGASGTGAASAEISMVGNATISTPLASLYGVPGATPTTTTYTLIHGAGAGSSLAPATVPTLGNVYNATNFTVTQPVNFTRTATDLKIDITAATSLAGNRILARRFPRGDQCVVGFRRHCHEHGRQLGDSGGRGRYPIGAKLDDGCHVLSHLSNHSRQFHRVGREHEYRAVDDQRRGRFGFACRSECSDFE